MLDAIQTSVDSILWFNESLSNNHIIWDQILSENQIHFDETNEALFSKLQIEIVPRIWNDLSSLQRSPRSKSENLPNSERRNCVSVEESSEQEEEKLSGRKRQNNNSNKKKRKPKMRRLKPSDSEIRNSNFVNEDGNPPLSPSMLRLRIEKLRKEIDRLEKLLIESESPRSCLSQPSPTSTTAEEVFSLNSPRSNQPRTLLAQNAQKDDIDIHLGIEGLKTRDSEGAITSKKFRKKRSKSTKLGQLDPGKFVIFLFPLYL